jgi:hypothetical protein
MVTLKCQVVFIRLEQVKNRGTSCSRLIVLPAGVELHQTTLLCLERGEGKLFLHAHSL